MATAASSNEELQRELRLGKQRRRREEALLALLFVAPATIITLMFRIWPVVFGFFVSLHQWRARTRNFLGLDQYVRAMGNGAYVLAFLLSALLVYGAYRTLQSAQRQMTEGQGDFYPFLLPGFTLAVGVIALSLGFAAGINELILAGLGLLILGGGLQRWFSRRFQKPYSEAHYSLKAWQFSLLSLLALGLFAFTISEILLDSALAFDLIGVLAPQLYLPSLGSQMLAGAILGIALSGVLVVRWARPRLPDDYTGDWMRGALRWVTIVLVLVAIGTLVFLIAAFQYDQVAASAVRNLERGDVEAAGRELTGLDRDAFRTRYGTPKGVDLANDLIAWPQVVSVSLGFFIMFVAYRLWREAAEQHVTPGTGRLLLLAILLAVAGWLLIGELPQAMAVGDPQFFQSLLITTTYALGTVPVQLSLGLFLAYLLFYEVRLGKSLYRMIYFMPYVAPTVATATVFGIIFSSRPYSLANRALGLLGIDPLSWLLESKGIFQIIAERITPGVVLPDFLMGPSLALISIILYNIWVFSGYNAVIFLAGLGAIPADLYEAAKVDGAGRWQAFRRITFPLLSPTTFFLTILSITGTFRAFTHIYVMRQAAARGTADTTSVYIFVQFWQFNQWGYASAMAFVLFGIILILTLVQNEVSKGRVFYG